MTANEMLRKGQRLIDGAKELPIDTPHREGWFIMGTLWKVGAEIVRAIDRRTH